jgi:hypothetical protein
MTRLGCSTAGCALGGLGTMSELSLLKRYERCANDYNPMYSSYAQSRSDLESTILLGPLYEA